jgi:hypothetical protein
MEASHQDVTIAIALVRLFKDAGTKEKKLLDGFAIYVSIIIPFSE